MEEEVELHLCSGVPELWARGLTVMAGPAGLQGLHPLHQLSLIHLSEVLHINEIEGHAQGICQPGEEDLRVAEAGAAHLLGPLGGLHEAEILVNAMGGHQPHVETGILVPEPADRIRQPVQEGL